MEACNAVEREVDRVLSKFNDIHEHAGRTLSDLVAYISDLKRELENGEFWT